MKELFKEAELERPKNFDQLEEATKQDFFALIRYKVRGYKLNPKEYKHVLKLLTEIEDNNYDYSEYSLSEVNSLFPTCLPF